MIELEVVLTGHTRWWVRLANWLGAGMKWTHALLRYCSDDDVDGWIIEACEHGVVKRRWNPHLYESYCRFRLKDGYFKNDEAKWLRLSRMISFANGEVGKRYKYEALGPILMKVLHRIFGRVPMMMFIGTGEVCTSLVDRTFMYEGFDLVPYDDSPYVLPDEIAKSSLLTLIKEVSNGNS